MLKWVKHQFSDEARERRSERLQERKTEQEARKVAREQQRQEKRAQQEIRKAEQERQRQEKRAAEEARKAEQERQRLLASEAIAEQRRKKVAMRKAILDMLAEGKIPDLDLQISVPFKLQKAERWILAADNVEYAEMRVQRRIEGRSAGASVRVMKGVSVRTGASRGTPVERDVLTHRGRGMFAVSTKHLFFNGDRSFRIPYGKIVSAQSVGSMGLEIVRDRASALPEYFGIGGEDADFVAELIHLLPEVDFGRGDPPMQSVESYMLGVGDIGADDMLVEC